MEFEVKKMELPEIPEFNFEELKKDLLEKTTKYENIIYNDNEISQAKKDRADLNKLKKAINDKRISMEKEYMKPFNEFKDKVKEIIDIIDKPIAAIDGQVKEYEKQQAEKKQAAIQELFKDKCPFAFDWLNVEQISKPNWHNASVSMKSIEEDMCLTFSMIESELKSIETLDFKEQAIETYKQTLSMSAVLERVASLKESEKILAEKKEESKPVEVKEELKPVEVKKEHKEWMDMAICLSASDFDLFDAWTKENGIEWRLK